ncbi:MAG: Os1348 family NHLP clan protein [Euryarchaeota archaeon]|nr:Os1348 family NHLP clan protein [Euryarchaeota archaeon]
MNQEKIDEFVGKLIKDEKLMDSFLKDPVSTIKSEGFSITSEQETKLNSIDKKNLEAMVKEPIVGNSEDSGCSYHLCG